MCILNERPRISVEIDTFFRIEQHILAGVDLQDEVLQGTHTHDTGYLVAFLFAHVGKLAQLHARLQGIVYHQLHQVVGIDHRSLTTFHLAVGQFHHTIAKVCKFLSPLKAQTVEQD